MPVVYVFLSVGIFVISSIYLDAIWSPFMSFSKTSLGLGVILTTAAIAWTAAHAAEPEMPVTFTGGHDITR